MRALLLLVAIASSVIVACAGDGANDDAFEGSAACAKCHMPEYQSARDHPGKKPTTCGKCHSQSTWHGARDVITGASEMHPEGPEPESMTPDAAPSESPDAANEESPLDAGQGGKKQPPPKPRPRPPQPKPQPSLDVPSPGASRRR